MSTIEFRTESQGTATGEAPAPFDPNRQILSDYEDLKTITAEVLGVMLTKNRERGVEHFGEWPPSASIRRFPRRRPSGSQPVYHTGGWTVEDVLGHTSKGEWKNAINRTMSDTIERVTQQQPNGKWRLESVQPVIREFTENVLKGTLTKDGSEEFDPLARSAQVQPRRLRRLDLDVVFVDMNNAGWIERPDGKEQTDTSIDQAGATAAVANAAAQATLAALVQAVQPKAVEAAPAAPAPDATPRENPVIPNAGRFQTRK